jgi:ABC-type transport system involved in multi-copper enzyme maturation permease subunit
LVIIYRAFGELFYPFASLRKIGCVLFYIAAIVALSFAIFATAFSPAKDGELLVRLVVLLDRNVALVEAGLLLALFAAALCLGLSWRNASLGIVLGFGVWACADLAVMSARAYVGHIGNEAASTLRSLAYSAAVLIWFVYMALPHRGMAEQQVRVPANDLRPWNQSLRELLSR